MYSSPKYKSYVTDRECNTDYFHKEWRDDDPHGSYCTSKYLYGAPPTKAGVDFNNSAINRLDLGNKTHTSTYEPTNYGRSSDPFERFDEYFDKSYNNPDFDDSIREHSNSYYNTTERQFLAPTKRVHYSGGNDSVSSGSISGRSDTPYDHYASPFDTSLSPDPNAYSSHPYRNDAPLILHEAVGPPFRHLHGPNSSYRSALSDSSADLGGRKPHFVPITRLEDAQAIRAAEFHPNGQLYAIGSNSKTLRICGYPKSHELRSLREDHVPHQPSVLSKRVKHHKGSIYCLAWNTTGDLLATGSNDKTIKMMRFNGMTNELEGGEAELTMHDGTVRDMCFMEDLSNRSSLLISGGAGDCKIYVTDCDTMTPFQALSGHSGNILSLHTWGGAMFVSGSQDRTIRFWDLRTRGCVNLITAPSASGKGPGSAVAAVCVDPSGKLLVSGHEDSNCMLYDIRGGRIIQTFQPHSSDIRTIRFSNKAYYLLTGGYDNKVVLTDLQGDLTQPLPSIVVAEHSDKVIQGRWHPYDFSFLTTSADKCATLWALPN